MPKLPLAVAFTILAVIVLWRHLKNIRATNSIIAEVGELAGQERDLSEIESDRFAELTVALMMTAKSKSIEAMVSDVLVAVFTFGVLVLLP